MQSLESGEARDGFQATTPLMLATIGFALNAGEEIAAQEALEMFIEVSSLSDPMCDGCRSGLHVKTYPEVKV